MLTERPKSTQPAKAYRLARTMLNQAVEDGLLRINPCRVKNQGRETPAERPVAMPDQVAKITAAMDAEYQAMVLLAAYGSLRFGELAGLRRHRVEYSTRQSKSRNRRWSWLTAVTSGHPSLRRVGALWPSPLAS